MRGQDTLSESIVKATLQTQSKEHLKGQTQTENSRDLEGLALASVSLHMIYVEHGLTRLKEWARSYHLQTKTDWVVLKET